MKKYLLLLLLSFYSIHSFASDKLHGSVWKTIDDEIKQAKAVVKFTEQKNGTLSASIQSVLTPGEENACTKCEGKYHNKSLKGVTIVYGLKNVNGKYEGGTILDPKNGKTYKLKGELAGNKLNLRGYMGVAALGRNQTWIRAN